MNSKLWKFGTLILVFVAPIESALAIDYVRLRTGQVIEGAILREDSSVVVMTDWENRHLQQPPLTVFTHDEVHSIWFVDPREEEHAHLRYVPHVGSIEVGGSALFQTWAETKFLRRHLFMLELQGGFTITPALGFDLAAAFTVPLGGASDSVWHRYDPAYHVSMSVVAHPFIWKGMIPYVLAGGGAAVGTPLNGVILSSSHDVRSLINAGLGVKWGLDHVGMRVEWRHHFYTWTPDEVDAFGNRVSERTADASMIRAGLFYFR